jgi:predicted nucleic acid-binding protein
MPSQYKALLDACVLFPAALRDTLLRAAARGHYRVLWSDLILDEATRNLVEKGFVNDSQATHLVEQMASYFPGAKVTGFESLIPSMLNNEKDRHVLAAAVVGDAEVIVTSNLKHFPESALAPFGIEAQSPDDFLMYLADLYPSGMVRIVLAQTADLRNPPMSVGEVLADIALQAPRFADFIRQALETRSPWR